MVIEHGVAPPVHVGEHSNQTAIDVPVDHPLGRNGEKLLPRDESAVGFHRCAQDRCPVHTSNMGGVTVRSSPSSRSVDEPTLSTGLSEHAA